LCFARAKRARGEVNVVLCGLQLIIMEGAD